MKESQFHLDRISLEAIEFREDKLPDGRTVARLKRTLFPVSYAKGAHVAWRIRQRPNRPQIEMADGVKDPAAVRRLRAEAQALRAETTSHVTAEANIKRAVAASLARQRE